MTIHQTSRRGILAGLGAAASIPLTLATASASPAPAPITTPENPGLLALGEQIDPLLNAYRAAAERKREARAMADALCPPLPDDLVCGHNEFSWAGCCTGEFDLEGDIVHAPGEWRSRFILSAQLTKDAIARGNIPGSRRTKLGKEVWRRVKIAEKYEGARESAIERSGILKAAEERERSRLRLEMLARDMRKHEPVTMAGIVIMARALAAYAEADHSLSAVFLGRELAAATLRVASASTGV
jgi:hypothetical protein